MRIAYASLLTLPLFLASCTGASGVDEEAEMGESSDPEAGDGDGDAPETGDGDGEPETGDGDGDGEAETGDGDGDPGCEPAETSEVAGCAALVGEGFCSEGAAHVPEGSEIEWLNNPPHSGNHYPSWETKGEHVDPVARGNWVHNLEHGWVILVHNCEADCEAELDVLRDVIAMRPDKSILLTADPLLDGPRFAAISWTWVHEFDAPDLDELLCFVDQHHDHAPESVH